MPSQGTRPCTAATRGTGNLRAKYWNHMKYRNIFLKIALRHIRKNVNDQTRANKAFFGICSFYSLFLNIAWNHRSVKGVWCRGRFDCQTVHCQTPKSTRHCPRPRMISPGTGCLEVTGPEAALTTEDFHGVVAKALAAPEWFGIRCFSCSWSTSQRLADDSWL